MVHDYGYQNDGANPVYVYQYLGRQERLAPLRQVATHCGNAATRYAYNRRDGTDCVEGSMHHIFFGTGELPLDNSSQDPSAHNLAMLGHGTAKVAL